jgi:hypothetical protein
MFGWFPGQGITGAALAGVGLALGGVALGTGIYGITLSDSVDENIEAHNANYDAGCRQNTDLCLRDASLINRDGERAADYKNVAMITGIVGASLFTVGAVLFLFSDESPLAPTDEPATKAEVRCGAGLAAVGCAGRF